MAGQTPTADPSVFVEETRHAYTRYRQIDPERPDVVVRRWEVHGTCDRRGDCLIGAVVETPDGPTVVRSKRHLARLVKAAGRDRIDSELDVPVTPEFDTCCGADRFSYVELPVE